MLSLQDVKLEKKKQKDEGKINFPVINPVLILTKLLNYWKLL